MCISWGKPPLNTMFAVYRMSVIQRTQKVDSQESESLASTFLRFMFALIRFLLLFVLLHFCHVIRNKV